MEFLTLPAAARRLDRSEHSLRWLLRRRPDLDDAIPRLGGRRMLRPADLERIRDAYAARTRTTTPRQP